MRFIGTAFVAGVRSDFPGEGHHRVEGGHADSVMDEFLLRVQVLFAGGRSPSRTRAGILGMGWFGIPEECLELVDHGTGDHELVGAWRGCFQDEFHGTNGGGDLGRVFAGRHGALVGLGLGGVRDHPLRFVIAGGVRVVGIELEVHVGVAELVSFRHLFPIR